MAKAAHRIAVSAEVNWSEPVIHEVRNIGKTPSHAIRVELK